MKGFSCHGRISFSTGLSFLDLEKRGVLGTDGMIQVAYPNLGWPSIPMHTQGAANEARRDLIYGASFLLML